MSNEKKNTKEKKTVKTSAKKKTIEKDTKKVKNIKRSINETKHGMILISIFMLIVVVFFAIDFAYLVPNYMDLFERNGCSISILLSVIDGISVFVLKYKFLILGIVVGIFILAALLYKYSEKFVKILTKRWHSISLVSFIFLLIILAFLVFVPLVLFYNVWLFFGPIF